MQSVVQLQRHNIQEPWGFRLQGGVDFNSQLSVKKVTDGTPSAGYLQAGDLILGIGNTGTNRMSHMDAHNLIKRAGTSLTLTVQKSHGGSDDSRLQSIRPKGPVKFSPWKHQ